MSSGFSTTAVDAIRVAAEAHVGDPLAPGLVALVARGDDVHVEALGSQTAGGPPMARDTLFRIASTTKPITAAAALVLVQEGLLGLDEPIDRLIPELADRRVMRRIDGPLDDTVPAARSITTRDLLTFTFGFGMVPEMFRAAKPWPIVTATKELRLATLGPPDPAEQPDPDTWIGNFATLPLLAQPGERWMYNTAASVLGVLLARAAGEPIADVLDTRVFEPLGMRDTSFWTSETDRLATAYLSKPDGLVAWDAPDGVWSRPPAFGDGGAGLVSTADDLFAFGRMLLRGGAPMLSAELAHEMTTGQLSESQRAYGGLIPGFFDTRSWGLGLAVQDDGAYGWDGGFGTTWLVDPVRDLIVIVLTQRAFPSPAPPQVHLDIRAAAYATLA
jgi:CubicO group peptidase (beta-lactamase class C family)